MFVSSVFLASVLVSASTPASKSDHLRDTSDGDGVHIVEYPVKRVYLPSGFDSNDYPEILVEGEFPSQCYEFDRGTMGFKDDKIYFRVFAKQYDGPCTQVIVPFLEAVKLNRILPEGLYQTVHVFNKTEKTVGYLNVSHTESTSRDDFTYAHVDSSAVQMNSETGERFLTLFGNQTSSCHDFDMDRTSVRMTSKGFVEVRPILKEPEEGTVCLQIWQKYSKNIPIPEDFPAGRFAFYIRKGEGGSFYKLDQIPRID